MNVSHKQLSDAVSHQLVGDVVAVRVETDQKEGFANTGVGNGREDLAACNK